MPRRFAALLFAACIGATGAGATTTREDCHPITTASDAEWAELEDAGHHEITPDSTEDCN